MNLKKTIKTMIYLVSTASIALLLFHSLRRFEFNSLYFPDKDVMADPSGIGLRFENIYLKTPDGIRLHAWLVPHPDAKAFVLYSHGNGGNIAYRLDTIEWFHQMGVSLFLFDWRGYGKSEGIPSEKGLYADIRAVWEYLTRDRGIPENRIFIFGESLGAAPAVELSMALEQESRPPAGLVLEGAFASTREMGRVVLPHFPVSIFPIRDRYDNLSKIGKLKLPKLIAHGKEDEVVPFYQGEMLGKAAPQPKIFLPLEGGHNDARFRSGSLYQNALKEFFKSN